MITDIFKIKSMRDVIDNCISTTDCTTRIFLKSLPGGQYISFKKNSDSNVQVTERRVNGRKTIIIHDGTLIFNSFPTKDVALVALVKDKTN
jgi:hypothetical protein